MDAEYEVERILSTRRAADNQIEYFIKWKGYDASHNTWELEDNVSQHLVESYWVDQSEAVNSSWGRKRRRRHFQGGALSSSCAGGASSTGGGDSSETLSLEQIRLLEEARGLFSGLGTVIKRLAWVRRGGAPATSNDGGLGGDLRDLRRNYREKSEALDVAKREISKLRAQVNSMKARGLSPRSTRQERATAIEKKRTVSGISQLQDRADECNGKMTHPGSQVGTARSDSVGYRKRDAAFWKAALDRKDREIGALRVELQKARTIAKAFTEVSERERRELRRENKRLREQLQKNAGSALDKDARGMVGAVDSRRKRLRGESTSS